MKHYLGIDIGGTAVKLGIVDEAGAVLAKAEESVNFDGYRTPILTTVLKAAQAFLAAQNIPAESLAGIGVSATGQIDSRKGIVAGTCGNLPNYIGAPIKAELEKTFGLPFKEGYLMITHLLTRIDLSMHSLSKGQKRIALYIEEHYDKAAFMTASKLGETVGVSESTVVRFATELGYDGYPKLQKAMQEMIRDKLTSVQRIEVTSSRIGNDDVLNSVLNQDIDKIRRTIEETSHEDFERAVDKICNADRIYRSRPAAACLSLTRKPTASSTPTTA